MSRHQPQIRRKKLIKPRLQLRLIGAFAAITATALLFQAVLLSRELTSASVRIAGAERLADEAPEILGRVLLYSFVAILPLLLLLGVLATFRVAGPIRRFEIYLTALARGQVDEPCRIRKGDELQDFCTLLNEATEPLWNAPSTDEASEPETEQQAA